MKILILHNRYRQRGGEDAVVEAESALLRAHGHEVTVLLEENDSLQDRGLAQVGTFLRSLNNRAAARRISTLVREQAFEIVHVHNVVPRFSPAVLRGASQGGAAVVQTLHNFRLACASAILHRQGAICEKCLGGSPLWAVVHGCYRGSRKASFAVASGILLHRMLGTYHRHVHQFIALTEFSRQRFAALGLDARRISVKPNFLAGDPGPGKRDSGPHGEPRYALYAGRITEEKGIATLLDAWRRHDPGIPLIMAGDGPAAHLLPVHATEGGPIRWMGHQDNASMMRLMAGASLLVLPSEWYEGFPMVLVEAYARGVPVVASRLGSLAELVTPGDTGLLFEAGDAAGLAAAVRRVATDDVLHAHCSQGARRTFLDHYGAETNHTRLLEIYRRALALRRTA